MKDKLIKIKMKMKMKIVIVLLIIGMAIAQDSAHVKVSKNEFSCEDFPALKYLEISTNLNENSDVFNIPVVKDCKVDLQWRVKDDNNRQCEIPQRVFEGEDNLRRPFRFHYKKNSLYKDKISVKSVHLDYAKNIADSALTKTEFVLYPGDFYDVYVEYDCLDIQDPKTSVPKNWYKLKFAVEFDYGKTISFEYMKICTASYADALDFSHFIIIGLIFLVIYVSVLDQFNSKLEWTIVTKFPELKNPENLLLMAIVTGIVLIFLYVVNILAYWIFIALLLVGPVSIGMISEALISKTQFREQLENKTIYIPSFGPVTHLFIISIAIGYVILFFCLISHNWIISNLLSISIAIITIRIIKLTSFKFIFSVYVFTFLYELLWLRYRSTYYGENYKLTNQVSQYFPIRILCPELVSSPFSACNYLPISDIILPGIFLLYSRKFDEEKSAGDKLYFKCGVGSLAAGLVVSLIVYYTKKLPTPSFLFTGPLILVVTLILAQVKGELAHFFEGFKSTEYGDTLKNSMTKFAHRESLDKPGNYQPPTEMMDLKTNDTQNRK